MLIGGLLKVIVRQAGSRVVDRELLVIAHDIVL